MTSVFHCGILRYNRLILEGNVDVEQVATIEGSHDLYTITLPPGMSMCVSAAGAMSLLNRHRSSIWNYVQAGRLRSINVAGNVVIPLLDIAGMLGMTETQIYNVAVAYKLPMWQIHLEGG